jgi:hypothetical protein
MIPDIIKDKIDWYIWKGKQREICREYHKRFHWFSFGKHVGYLNTRYGEYNYRDLRYNKIFDYTGSIVGELPTNY